MNDQDTEKAQFAICITDGGYPEALEVMKLYQVLPDSEAAKHGQLRVIDESGEDYLYFEDLFIKIDFPFAIERVLAAVASRP